MDNTRNLLAEAEANMQPAAKLRQMMPPTSKFGGPQQPIDEPTAKQLVDSCVGSPGAVVPQALIIIVDSSYADEVVQEGTQNKELLTSLTCLQGVYWMIPPVIPVGHGKACWKQAAPVPPSDKPLVIFWCDDKNEGGWYAADSAWTTTKERDANKQIHVHMWIAKSEPSPAWQNCHVPFWTKKMCRGVHCIPYNYHLEKELELMKETVMMSMGAGGSEAAPSPGAADDNFAPGEGAKGNGKDKGKVRRAGWMEKCVKILVFYWSNQWDKLDTSAHEIYNTNELSKHLIDKGLREQAWFNNNG